MGPLERRVLETLVSWVEIDASGLSSVRQRKRLPRNRLNGSSLKPHVFSRLLSSPNNSPAKRIVSDSPRRRFFLLPLRESQGRGSIICRRRDNFMAVTLIHGPELAGGKWEFHRKSPLKLLRHCPVLVWETG